MPRPARDTDERAPVEGTKAEVLQADADDKMSRVIVGSVSSAVWPVFQQNRRKLKHHFNQI